MNPKLAASKTPRVLLLVETSTTYGRGVLEGIGRYVREQGPWSLFFEQRALEEPPSRWLRRWRGEGVISRTATKAVAQLIKTAGVPAVELMGWQFDEPAKAVATPWPQGGWRPNTCWAAGCRASVFSPPAKHGGRSCFARDLRSRCGRWGSAATCTNRRAATAGSIPNGRTPTSRRSRPGCGGCQNRPACWFLPCFGPLGVPDFCRSMGLTVPDQIAVITAPDDPLLCNMTTPALSTIDQCPARIGFEAAALLGRMMAGEPPPRHTLAIPPGRIVPRHSTDLLAIDDADVAHAIRFIREHACAGIEVQDVFGAVGLSAERWNGSSSNTWDAAPRTRSCG